MPPLNTKRPKRGVAPFQNVKSPSSLKILTKQFNVDVYSLSAPKACIRVFTVSMGMVVYTVTIPVKEPKANVAAEDKFSSAGVLVASWMTVLIAL